MISSAASKRHHDWDRPEIGVGRVVGPFGFPHSLYRPFIGKWHMAHRKQGPRHLQMMSAKVLMVLVQASFLWSDLGLLVTSPMWTSNEDCPPPRRPSSPTLQFFAGCDVHSLSLCTLPQMEGGESEQRHHEQFLPQMLLACCLLPRTDAINRHPYLICTAFWIWFCPVLPSAIIAGGRMWGSFTCTCYVRH